MDTMTKRTWAEIDISALEHNYRELRAVMPEGCRFLGVCKANAYGHGTAEMARKFEELGAEYIGVACYDEAKAVREAGVKLPILILSPSPAELAPELAALPAYPALGDIETAREMSRLLDGTGLRLGCHIKLETGMGRTGFNTDEKGLNEALELMRLPNIDVEGAFTHFAIADEPQSDFTDRQFERFMYACDWLEERGGESIKIRHCANTGAVLYFMPKMALDMIRPGLLIYGLYPENSRDLMNLRPVMSFKTRIYAITEHKAGDTLGYGRAYTCERDTRVAVLPVGYADGLHRILSNRVEVGLHGKRAKLVGRICMDAAMIDITDIPEARVGDEVTLFGADPDVYEVAHLAQSMCLEMTCAVSSRVPRVYIEGNK